MSDLGRPDGQLDLTEADGQLNGFARDTITEPIPVPRALAMAEVVVAGHICLDIIPTLVGDSTVLAPGRLVEAGRATLATGGPISNTGLALRKLGITTSLMGKVGDDLFGRTIIQLIEAQGADLASGMIVAPGEASSYSIILNFPGVDRTIIHAPGCNDTFGADDVRYDLLNSAGLFHFGYPPLMARMYQDNGAELVSIFKKVKEMGITTSLDLSMPDLSGQAAQADWRAILAAVLPYVDVFMPSIEELLLMLRRPLYNKLTTKARKTGLLAQVTPALVSELGKLLLGMGTKIVGLKAGHRGLYLRTADMASLEQMGRVQPKNMPLWANRELWAPCFATEVVGTTGSGDATIAGFLMGILRGMKPEAALASACAVGACCVEAPDAISGIRSWPETMERIAAGWPRLLLKKRGRSALNMPSAKWRWDADHEVWRGTQDVLY
ncbi:carbohydrate kinase family protein [Ktedonosporobacter rubrisoli]|uniref:Carbohydrate kinase family protein n=1 Tax=Ktedonosporobacter rubrisoli TaxID=2509675 RepID=A0A4P6K0E6_KTERU|nr:carbohydrate kinase family protein [Ktedonosporobacter rubrisoli]QBD81504.1 carbohydrate kinase family protein [Ktedonosporobacter rubrisoli]